MDILVFGGTRFFGRHLIRELIKDGHRVTMATRGRAGDDFGNQIERLILDRTDETGMADAFKNRYFDRVYDNLAYCSLDVKMLLDHIRCGRYIMTSSSAVYQLHPGTIEEDFRPEEEQLVWIRREDAGYADGKRQAECALTQCYPQLPAVWVRYPFVLGQDDYTNRLQFYVNHVMQGIPMDIDNADSQMSFVRSDEAGKLLAFLANNEVYGPLNACSKGTISIREILGYVEKKTKGSAIISSDGETAPYNSVGDYSLVTGKAERAGFVFTDLREWIFDLLDRLISINSTKDV